MGLEQQVREDRALVARHDEVHEFLPLHRHHHGLTDPVLEERGMHALVGAVHRDPGLLEELRHRGLEGRVRRKALEKLLRERFPVPEEIRGRLPHLVDLRPHGLVGRERLLELRRALFEPSLEQIRTRMHLVQQAGQGALSHLHRRQALLEQVIHEREDLRPDLLAELHPAQHSLGRHGLHVLVLRVVADAPRHGARDEERLGLAESRDQELEVRDHHLRVHHGNRLELVALEAVDRDARVVVRLHAEQLHELPHRHLLHDFLRDLRHFNTSKN